MTLAARLLALLIRAYQIIISPLTVRHCRFHPTCSAYGLGAVTRFGAVRGGFLTVWRILRCHPFNPGGLDPVPESFLWFKSKTFCTTNRTTERHDEQR